jgi:SAM-dependent methyltransferase
LETSGEFWRAFEETLLLELLENRSDRVLDLGCGPGRLAASLSIRSTMVVGVDVSPAMIMLAQAAAHPGNVHYCAMYATRSALKPASFDTVISLGMFEYMADPSPFLRVIFGLLKPGGMLVFTSHNRVPMPIRAWLFADESEIRDAMAISSSPGAATGSVFSHSRASIERDALTSRETWLRGYGAARISFPVQCRTVFDLGAYSGEEARQYW